MRSSFFVAALMIALLGATASLAQDPTATRNLSDWLQERIDTVSTSSPWSWLVGAELQFISGQNAFALSQYDDERTVNSGSILRDRVIPGTSPPDSIGRGWTAFLTPNGSPTEQQWRFSTVAPVLKLGCRSEPTPMGSSEFYDAIEVEYRYLDGSATDVSTSLHTIHANWWWCYVWKQLEFDWSMVGVRADIGTFDVQTPVFYYARGSVPATDYPFGQTYQKTIWNVACETSYGIAWVEQTLGLTAYARTRVAVGFARQNTNGVLRQSALGKRTFSYTDTDGVYLGDLKVGLKWCPRQLPRLEFDAGYLFELAPSAIYKNRESDPAVLNGVNLRVAYLF